MAAVKHPSPQLLAPVNGISTVEFLCWGFQWCGLVGGFLFVFGSFFFKWAAYVPCTKECFTVNLSFTHQAYPCTNDKECEVGRYCHSPHQATSACMMCRRKKKRCHRDGMCCPGNRCNNGICIPVTESILTPHIPALEGPRNKKNGHYASKDLGWQNLGRPRSKLSHIKGKITFALCCFVPSCYESCYCC
uniref:Dickkopf N-terminal cysteine-rich domain-containing protein n=1 Tax=Accipiter nisus TaxID=211598 RepID=A0A8B9MGK5_9AVES